MKDIVTLICEYIYETDNAMLVDYDGVKYWLPLSEIDYDKTQRYEKGNIIKIDVPVCWLMEKREMI